MKIAVDWDKCVSLGFCEGLAPNIFLLNEDSDLKVDESTPVSSAERERARSAVSGCPVNALRLIQDDE